MISALIGTVEQKEPTLIALNVNGVVYDVHVSLITSAQVDEKIKLHIVHIVREDGQFLYGFYDKKEKQMFTRLIKISGVGPKVALAICSTYDATTFATIVNAQDVSALRMVPGIGPKSAGRILVELGEFVTQTDEMGSQNFLEARMALESLGFKPDAINKTFKTCQGETSAELIKEALKKLQR